MKCIGCNKTIWFWQTTRNGKHIDCDSNIANSEHAENLANDYAARKLESKRARRRQLYREKQAAKKQASQEQQQ